MRRVAAFVSQIKELGNYSLNMLDSQLLPVLASATVSSSSQISLGK